MGIFDIFTGKPLKDAAKQQRGYLDKSKAESLGYIDQGLGLSLDALGSGYGNARDALTGGYNTATGAVDAGYSGAMGRLDSSSANARDLYARSRMDLHNANAAYDPLAALGTKYGGATSLALDALGVNGAEGANSARDAFQFTPGYEFNRDQGLEAINRRRNAGGMLDSGNADRDAQIFGAGLASNEYNTWMNNLLGFTNPELSATSGAASGRAGIGQSLASLGAQQAGFEDSLGRARADLESGRGSMLSSLASTYGTNMANNYTGEGTGIAGLQTGAANSRVGVNNAVMQPYLGTYKTEADASMTGSKNIWGLGMAAAQMAMGMPPTSLSSLGGGNPSSASFGSNPFTPSGNINPAYMQYG